MTRRIVGRLAVALVLAASALAEGILEGPVVKVIDGDTIEVLVDGESLRVRLAHIDTPERGQPWASRAKQALSRRIFGKEVRINAVALDGYGRTVGEVYADNVCVGCELVREGHAWVYRAYSKDPVLLGLEAEAREARRGLWGLPEASRVPPWEWRHTGAAARGADAGPAAEDPPCGAKRFCSEMRDCREARFHLERCGLSSLDGDGDGMPCESLCRRD